MTDHRIDESTIRALERLPELLAIAREVAGLGVTDDMMCHLGLCAPVRCSRCGPILEAKALIDFIDGPPPAPKTPREQELADRLNDKRPASLAQTPEEFKSAIFSLMLQGDEEAMEYANMKGWR